MLLKQSIIASVIMFAAMGVLGFVESAEEIHPNKPLSSFPRQIDSWKGEPARFDEKVYRVLGVDDSFLASYLSSGRGSVQLYIGFHQSQKEGDLIHSPKNCMPGAGWHITRTDLEKIPTPFGEKSVIRLDLQRGPDKQIVFYWFHSRGRMISSEYMQKIYLVIDAITRRRTDGAFVRLIAPVNDAIESRTVETLRSFASRIVPLLNDYLPS